MEVSDGMKQPGKTTHFCLSTRHTVKVRKRMEKKLTLIGNDRGMEVISERNNGPGAQLDTDPFLYKVDIVAVGIETL